VRTATTAGMARPAANWGGGGCTTWVALPGHNALCKHDSALPNSGPCCDPKEADRMAESCAADEAHYPCPSCLGKCGPAGPGGGGELFLLGTASSAEACQTMASAFAVDGLRCSALTWVAPEFGGVWASKCICATSAAPWPATVAAQDKCVAPAILSQLLVRLLSGATVAELQWLSCVLLLQGHQLLLHRLLARLGPHVLAGAHSRGRCVRRRRRQHREARWAAACAFWWAVGAVAAARAL
jgi:hypothetical protein